MKKKILVGLIAIMFVLLCIFIVVPNVTAVDTIETAFGHFRVELFANDKKMEPLGFFGDSLAFKKDGEIIEEFTVYVFAAVTGSGYDECEFEFTTTPGGSQSPRISASLSINGNQYMGPQKYYSGDLDLKIPLNTEALVHSATFQLSYWEQYFDTGEDYDMTIEIWFFLNNCKFRGVSGGVPDDWHEEYASFTIESGVSLQWEAEGPSCGDGTCEEEPYPGENCMSCTQDCGSCNAKVTKKTFNVVSGLSKSNYGIQSSYYNGNSWSSWSGSNTNWEHVEVFWYNNNFCAYVYPDSSANGKYLSGTAMMRVRNPEGPWIELPPVTSSWNNLKDGPCQVFSGESYTGGWYTGSYSSHRLIKNTDYEIKVEYTLSGSQVPPDSYTLTIEPAGYSSSTYVICKGMGDYTHPFTFNLEGGEYFWFDIVWYEDGGPITQGSGTMPNDDYNVPVEHHTHWQIKVTHFGGISPYLTSCNNPGTSTFESPAYFYRENGNYLVESWDALDQYRYQGTTISNNDKTVNLFWGGLQFYSPTTFSIIDNSSEFERYEYNGNYLGR